MKKLVVFAVAALLATPASAGFLIAVGNPGNDGTSNVIANGCPDGLAQTGDTVQGCLQDFRDITVNFTSDESLQFAGGQASVATETDNLRFNDLRIERDDGLSFDKLILNIDAEVDGLVNFFFGIEGNAFEFAVSGFQVDGAGQNFFNIVATNGDAFSYVRFLTSQVSITTGGGRNQVTLFNQDNVNAVNQVRLNAVQVVDVPEPGALGLLGLGLVGVAFARRRKGEAAI